MVEEGQPINIKEDSSGDGFDTRPVGDSNSSTIDSDPSGMMSFQILVGCQLVLGLIVVILMAVWMGHYREGFAWDGGKPEFDFHPLFMTIGLAFLYGNGIIVYRALRRVPKPTVKLVHFGLHFSALVFAIVGLVAAFDFHNASGIPNLYSLHSWLGLTTVILFCCQLLFGFTGFLYPRFSQDMKEKYIAIHVYFGLAIFVGAIMCCLTGSTEKIFFSIQPTYPKFIAEGILANTYGILIVVFGGLVVMIATKTSYKRLPDNVEYAIIK